jgi:hypothetical protein
MWTYNGKRVFRVDILKSALYSLLTLIVFLQKKENKNKRIGKIHNYFYNGDMHGDLCTCDEITDSVIIVEVFFRWFSNQCLFNGI